MNNNKHGYQEDCFERSFANDPAETEQVRRTTAESNDKRSWLSAELAKLTAEKEKLYQREIDVLFKESQLKKIIKGNCNVRFDSIINEEIKRRHAEAVAEIEDMRAKKGALEADYKEAFKACSLKATLIQNQLIEKRRSVKEETEKEAKVRAEVKALEERKKLLISTETKVSRLELRFQRLSSMDINLTKTGVRAVCSACGFWCEKCAEEGTFPGTYSAHADIVERCRACGRICDRCYVIVRLGESFKGALVDYLYDDNKVKDTTGDVLEVANLIEAPQSPASGSFMRSRDLYHHDATIIPVPMSQQKDRPFLLFGELVVSPEVIKVLTWLRDNVHAPFQALPESNGESLLLRKRKTTESLLQQEELHWNTKRPKNDSLVVAHSANLPTVNSPLPQHSSEMLSKFLDTHYRAAQKADEEGHYEGIYDLLQHYRHLHACPKSLDTTRFSKEICGTRRRNEWRQRKEKKNKVSGKRGMVVMNIVRICACNWWVRGETAVSSSSGSGGQ
jgi:hypothetical protein